LVAAYSRQDEFEADRGAAQLCGSVVMKSALSKLEFLHRITSRLPWNERVAHLQQTSGYSQWLLQEIAQGAAAPAENSSQSLFNKYSTHPLIRDRLAAIPADDKMPAANSPSAIQLLSHPDEIAVKLVTELQHLMADQEKKDSQALERFSRKTGRQAHLRPWQAFGVLLVLGGLFLGLIGFGFGEDKFVLEPVCLAAIVVGVVAIRLGAYRDRLELPVPDYTKLIHPPQEKSDAETIQKKQKAMDDELTQRFGKERKGRRATLLARESYAALESCDYLRAHVAARACLKFDKRSVEGALALAVASSAFAQIPTAMRLLAFVQRQTGFKSFSTCWGVAWASLLAGDCIRAEAMVEKALKLRPRQTALLPFLAIAQFRRGKLQSAIMHGRRACGADPGSKEKAKFLIARLLDGGFTREAKERIKLVRAALDSDPELMLSMTQLNLLQRDFDEAEHWANRIMEHGAAAQTLVRLGKLYEIARKKDRAASLYLQALAAGHYPEAHLGLGRLATEQNNKADARRHILAALDVAQPLGKEGVGTLQILHPILAQMLRLREPVANCRAWITAFPQGGQPAALAGQSFMVYAPDLQQAQEHFQTLLNAFQPEKPPLISPANQWSPAPKPMQPDGPVWPGVQGIWH
jgi:tetratricopeptide (TPR) repeat protein